MGLQDVDRNNRRSQAEREYREQKEKLRKLEELQARDYDIARKGNAKMYMNEGWMLKKRAHGPDSPVIVESDNYEISKEDLDQECENLFSDTPIRFIPRSDSQIDEAINNVISIMRITIPILWIKDA